MLKLFLVQAGGTDEKLADALIWQLRSTIKSIIRLSPTNSKRDGKLHKNGNSRSRKKQFTPSLKQVLNLTASKLISSKIPKHVGNESLPSAREEYKQLFGQNEEVEVVVGGALNRDQHVARKNLVQLDLITTSQEESTTQAVAEKGTSLLLPTTKSPESSDNEVETEVSVEANAEKSAALLEQPVSEIAMITTSPVVSPRTPESAKLIGLRDSKEEQRQITSKVLLLSSKHVFSAEKSFDDKSQKAVTNDERQENERGNKITFSGSSKLQRHSNSSYLPGETNDQRKSSFFPDLGSI